MRETSAANTPMLPAGRAAAAAAGFLTPPPDSPPAAAPGQGAESISKFNSGPSSNAASQASASAVSDTGAPHHQPAVESQNGVASASTDSSGSGDGGGGSGGVATAELVAKIVALEHRAERSLMHRYNIAAVRPVFECRSQVKQIGEMAPLGRSCVPIVPAAADLRETPRLVSWFHSMLPLMQAPCRGSARSFLVSVTRL